MNALLEAQIRQLFEPTGVEPDAETLAEYDRNQSLFGDDWKTTGEAGAQFHYCESLHSAGALERQVEPLHRGKMDCGEVIRFRRVQFDASLDSHGQLQLL